MKFSALKRVILIVVALVVLGAALAGCGGSSHSSSSPAAASSGHSSEWTAAKEAEFYAKLDQKATTSNPKLADSAAVKEYGGCLLAGFKPLYSPAEVLSEKSKEPKKAEEIVLACETKYRPALEAEAKKDAGSSGSGAETKPEKTESNLKQEAEKKIKEEVEAKSGASGSTGG